MTVKTWLESSVVDEATKEELRAVTNEEELEDRFAGLLEFGTGGLRGIIGAGTRRMNIYTVRHATQALADLINSKNIEGAKVVIAHDSRNFSREFAEAAACVLVANGIDVYLFDELRPTPELSFAVTDLGCIAGIDVTASHNPKEYNGYKVYWDDGAQLSPENADVVFAQMKETDMFDEVKTVCMCKAKEHITVLDKEYDERYLAKVLEQRIDAELIKKQSDMCIVYTPFHGAGYRLVPEVLKRAGFKNIVTVPEQMVLDGNFPTVKSPNPENPEGFARAIEIAKEHHADLIIGTDPDADRMGLIVNANGEYKIITGNQIGCLLLDYILRSKKALGILPENACAVKTIVTTELAAKICAKYGASIVNVLTGFKFIGEKMNLFKETGCNTFVFGFEESYGFLAGDYAHDKDSVFASLMISEAAAYYAEQGKTLWDALVALFEEHGTYVEKTVNIQMTGFDALDKMKSLMAELRANPVTELAGLKVLECKDYLNGIDGLPPSNVLYYTLDDGSVLVIRPSGTEPKVKLYVMVSAADKASAEAKAESLGKAFTAITDAAV
ncbi:MAG: phospho-sugar mutase [Clostridia bacterium]|nr:phospho-sugar mutase [Clostridia bacterium]